MTLDVVDRLNKLKDTLNIEPEWIKEFSKLKFSSFLNLIINNQSLQNSIRSAINWYHDHLTSDPSPLSDLSPSQKTPLFFWKIDIAQEILNLGPVSESFNELTQVKIGEIIPSGMHKGNIV